MKTYSWLAVGIITLMLAISGITYAQAQGAQPMQEGAQQQTQQGAMDLVNVNTASEQELQQVPGMDQSLAQSIVQYRQTNGPFDSVNDLTKVQGIDDQKLQGMRGYLTAEKLNINTAKAEELQNIPGMDQTLVQSIIQYRETNGPFGSVDELKQVEGIDDKKLQSIQEYVTAEKIDLNTASVEELLIIPGVDQSLAQNIVEYRQANGPFGSVDDLSQVSGITEENMSTIRDHVTVKEEGGGLF